LKRIVNVNVMPNLKELAFAQGWAIKAKHVEQILTHAELPPKLTKLTITDRKVDDVNLFATDAEVPQFTHFISVRALQFHIHSPERSSHCFEASSLCSLTLAFVRVYPTVSRTFFAHSRSWKFLNCMQQTAPPVL
jgi:hypothetical protein